MKYYLAIYKDNLESALPGKEDIPRDYDELKSEYLKLRREAEMIAGILKEKGEKG